MKRGLFTFSICAAAIALPAYSQEVAPAPLGYEATPTASDLVDTSASNDWYSQFSVGTAALQDLTPTGIVAVEDTTRFAWGSGDSWQFNVDLVTRLEDPIDIQPREEMSASATFQISPRFSIGGEFSIGANELDDTTQWDGQRLDAGIKLQSAFKF